ncbi:MAG TPA: DUF5127 domain-containing protein [Pseudonocardiaceae bacterium]|jgi:hypothetical protein|nr:DUF5127 domain-containing protein [Pseudonocardiaceae bacterium]
MRESRQDSAGHNHNPLISTGLSRRELLKLSGAAGLSLAALPILATTASAATGSARLSGAAGPLIASTFDPIRPPATPLAVRSPYLSSWLAADTLPGSWATFWTGHVTAMSGIARIDGTSYVFMGIPTLTNQPALQAMTQTNLTVTTTKSVFTLTGGGVELVVTFLSPVEPGDIRRQSMPLSYVSVVAASADGKAHQVGLYLDISGEWSANDVSTPVTWAAEDSSSVRSLSITPATPQVLAENGDMATWGTVVWSTPDRSGLTWEIGEDQIVRGSAVGSGVLGNVVDPDMPRAVNDRWPVLGLNLELGTVKAASAPFVVSIGHIRNPAVSYLGTDLAPLWTSYWQTWEDMVAFFHGDVTAATARATALDARIKSEATAAGGAKYAALCTLALRQAYGATELAVRDGQPWAFLKEISSDGNVSTVDVTYPGSPAFLYLDPGYLGLLLAPLLDFAENGGWNQVYAEHDLGSSYPNASGLNPGNTEPMPVEESANMLIMSAGYIARIPAAQASAFALLHYPVLKGWADYLVANALDPGYQNQTDDFTGFIAHSVNLALKGIIGLGAMSQISTAAGNSADAKNYLSTAQDYIAQWAVKAEDTTNTNLKLAYDQPDTWSLKYNGYPDTLLGTGLVTSAVAAQEAAWYLAHENQYGVPLDLRHSYTKTDWQLWTAAWQHNNKEISQHLIEDVYDFANTSTSRVPFSDWYDTISGRQVGFQARPVIGGVFALLSLTKKP